LIRHTRGVANGKNSVFQKWQVWVLAKATVIWKPQA